MKSQKKATSVYFSKLNKELSLEYPIFGGVLFLYKMRDYDVLIQKKSYFIQADTIYLPVFQFASSGGEYKKLQIPHLVA